MAVQPYEINLAANMQPGNLYNLTGVGSYLDGQAGFTATPLLMHAMAPTIVDSFNKNFASTMFLMSLQKKYVNDVAWTWMQKPYLESPVTVSTGGAAAVNNAGTGTVNQTIPVTDAAFLTVALGHSLLYPGTTTHAIVTATNGAASPKTITVTSYAGQSLPALAVGDEMGNGGPRNSDGQAMATSVYESFVARYGNTMEQIGYHSAAWDPIQGHIMDLAGTTNYKAGRVKDVTQLFFNSITHTIFLGGGGIGTLPGGLRKSYATKGMFKQQADDGVSITPVTAANCIAAMREAIYDNSIKEGPNEWILAGPKRLLDKFGTGEKSDRIRYRYNDTTYNSYLNRYEFFGGYGVTPLDIPHFENRGSFGSGYKDTVLLFKKEDVSLVGLQGWPMFTMATKIANNQNTNPITGYANIEAVQYSALMGLQWENAGFSARFQFIG